MGLPPRPHEIEDDHQPTMNGKKTDHQPKMSFDPDFDFLEPKELKHWARKAKAWAKRGDVFLYFISGAKLRNPAAAQALLKALG